MKSQNMSTYRREKYYVHLEGGVFSWEEVCLEEDAILVYYPVKNGFKLSKWIG